MRKRETGHGGWCRAHWWRLSCAALLALSAQLSACPLEDDERIDAILDATGFAGSMLIVQSGVDRCVAGHGEDVDVPRIPASTFKVMSALVALETGVIAGPDAIIPWDGQMRERGELNRDLSLRDAFRLSAVPHFQALVRDIGRTRMTNFVDAVAYGNGDLSGPIDRFWLTGALRISQRQQVEFLLRLYEGDLPFSPETMAAVRSIMEIESRDGYVLRAKTGWATLADGISTGWWIGWVERGSQITLFATALEARDPDPSFGPARIDATRAALALHGILPAAAAVEVDGGA